MPSAIRDSKHGQTPGCSAGTLPVSEDMELPDYARLLRDAARASACGWAEHMDQNEHDRAVRHLGIALRDLWIVVARLAWRFRLGAMARSEPGQISAVTALTASMRTLGQAWLILKDDLPADADPAHSACVPGDLLCFAARRAATWSMPAAGLDEIRLLVADTLAALEAGTACLAAGASQPLAACLTEVRACLRFAGRHVPNDLPPAVPDVIAREGRPESPPGALTFCRRTHIR